MKNTVELIAGTLGDEIHLVNDTVDFEYFVQEATDYILEYVRENTPHGEYGGDEEKLIFKYKDLYYLVKIDNLSWNRHDKQYYYLDMWEKPRVTYKEITPEFATNGVIDELWIKESGTIVNNKKVFSEDDVFYPLEFIEDVEEISLPQLLQIQHILKVKNYELNQFGFNVVI